MRVASVVTDIYCLLTCSFLVCSDLLNYSVGYTASVFCMELYVLVLKAKGPGGRLHCSTQADTS